MYGRSEAGDGQAIGGQGQQKQPNNPPTVSMYNAQAASSRRGFWSPEEDRKLMELISIFGASNWVKISNSLNTRTPKQCRERYHQNLKPSLNRTPISAEEGELIEKLVAKHGKKWAEIARHLNGRSDNAVKNWWNGGANRKRRATVQMKASPEEQFSAGVGQPHEQQGQDALLPQPLPQPHPPQQIAFKTSMFGDQGKANTPPLSSTSSTNSTSPYRSSTQRLASLDVDNVSNLMRHHHTLANAHANSNANAPHPHNQGIILPPLNSMNNSLPSLILPSKKRLLDENNPISRRHSYANTLYSVHNQNTSHATSSNPNLSNILNVSNQPNSLSNSGQSSPYHGSPLVLSNQASRNNSISVPNFEFSAIDNSNATSLTESRRSSYNPDFFPNPLKDNQQISHKRNISQNSFNSSMTPSYRYSVSSGSSMQNSNVNFNANNSGNYGNTNGHSIEQNDQSPTNTKGSTTNTNIDSDKKKEPASDAIIEDQDTLEKNDTTDNTKISVSSLLD